MSRRRFALCSSILVALVAYGCSPAADGPSSIANDAEVKTDSAFVFETEGSDTSPAWFEDTAIPETSLDTAPTCTKTSDSDEPDDEFKDDNCDGIDGDKSKAVFVATTGSDDAAGTIDAPLKTIGKAIKSGKDVYVCNGTYAETVVVESTAVRVFGGYDCKEGWKRTLERAAIAPTKGVPLMVSKVATGGAYFDRITLRAPDGTDAGESSIAAIVSESKAVTFVNSRLTAGNAADGRSGDPVGSFTAAARNGADGIALGTHTCSRYGTNPSACSTRAAGGYSWFITCEVLGGEGGGGGVWAVSTDARLPAYSGGKGSTGNGGAPGGSSSISAGPGLPGGAGADGGAGSSSTLGFGTLHAAGYDATNSGTDGAEAMSGGGGGGGWGGRANWIGSSDFADYWYNGGGAGQGGFGGCGGAGGKRGTGGGASIAVISWKSEIKLTKTTLDTGDGGRGGNGSSGAEGQAGGLGGKGAPGTTAGYGQGYDGGPGGRGGRGGAGGAGGGGPSIAIVFVGAEPTRDAVTFNLGRPGAGGASAAGAGATGVGKDTFEVK